MKGVKETLIKIEQRMAQEFITRMEFDPVKQTVAELDKMVTGSKIHILERVVYFIVGAVGAFVVETFLRK
jgi:hypothetical protein